MPFTPGDLVECRWIDPAKDGEPGRHRNLGVSFHSIVQSISTSRQPLHDSMTLVREPMGVPILFTMKEVISCPDSRTLGLLLFLCVDAPVSRSIVTF